VVYYKGKQNRPQTKEKKMSKLQITKATIQAHARWQATGYNMNSAAKRTLYYCQKKQIGKK
jgi:hypothetical protein